MLVASFDGRDPVRRRLDRHASLPVFPGTIIILAGALLHRMMLGPEKSIGWGTIAVLVLLDSRDRMRSIF